MKAARRSFMAGFAGLLSLLSIAPVAAAGPQGWGIAGSNPAGYDFGIDKTVFFDGGSSATITAKTSTPTGFGTLMQTISAEDYRGKRLRLSVMLRTRSAGRAQMWFRVDGLSQQVLAFDNMESRPVTGTTDWTRYDIVLDVPQSATDLAYGALLIGAGEVWMDAFKLEAVSDSVPTTSSAPQLPKMPVNTGFED